MLTPGEREQWARAVCRWAAGVLAAHGRMDRDAWGGNPVCRECRESGRPAGRVA